MPLISRQIPALFNGVSQQPAPLRLPSQSEAQVNCYATVVDGLKKRPGTENVAKLSDASMSDGHLHIINRDVTERYSVFISDGDLKVFDLADGTEKVVNFPEGTGYLDVTSDADFAAITVADYTFIVNKEVVVATKVAPTSVPSQIASGDWYVQPRSSWASSVNAAVNQRRFYNPAHVASQGTKQTFSDLPDAGQTVGDVWKIQGSDSDGFAAYYVIWTGSVWEETHGDSGELTFDESTMPHALVRLDNGEFDFKPFAWSVRRVGDDATNPPPTFVGRTIEDVFYYKNRLGFATDENVVFSGAGDFGNFWRNTVVDLLDSDVVDAAVSSKNVALIKYAVPFNNRLMLFADQTQFALNVDQLLTPSTVSIDIVTDYEMSTLARPVAIGDDVYFVTESGAFSRIREYFVSDDDANNTDAADITAHVPRYLPKNIIKLTGNANEDVLFALSSDYPNRVYNYKFYWNEDGKIQSAWNYWEFNSVGTILDIEVLDNELYLVVERGDGVYLEKADLQSGAVTGALAYQVLLDRLVEMTGVHDAGPDETTFTLPFLLDYDEKADYKIVRGDDFGSNKLALIDPTQYQFDPRDIDITTWTAGAVTYTPNDATARDGTLTATKVADTDPVAHQEGHGAGLAYTSGDVWCAALPVKKDSVARTVRFPALRLWFGGADFVDIRLDSSTGEFDLGSASGNTVLIDGGVIDQGDYWVLWIAAKETVGATLVRAPVYPSIGADVNWAYDPTIIGDIHVDDVQLFKGSEPVTQIVVPDDESAGECPAGLNYNSSFTFSEQFAMNGDKAITTGRLMLRTFVVYFTNTAFFQTVVAPYGSDPLTEGIVPSAISTFTGKTLGAASLTLGEPQFHTGSYAFQIYGDSRQASITINNPSHVQSQFQSAEWEALYFNRARVV